MISVQHKVLDLYFRIDHSEIRKVVLFHLFVHCAVNRTQPCDVILGKTVTSCCHDLSGTKTTDILE